MHRRSSENSITFTEAIFGQLWWTPSERDFALDEASSLQEEIVHSEQKSIVAKSDVPVEVTSMAVNQQLELSPAPVPVFIFAIDLPGRDTGLFHHEFSTETEAELMLKKMILGLGLEENRWRIWVSAQVDHAISDQELSQFQQVIAQFSQVHVLSFGVRITEFLLGVRQRVSEVHGQQLVSRMGIPLTPLFHPEYLLINPGMKRQVWEALTRLMPPV